jgi:hypothetical protein
MYMYEHAMHVSKSSDATEAAVIISDNKDERESVVIIAMPCIAKE